MFVAADRTVWSYGRERMFRTPPRTRRTIYILKNILWRTMIILKNILWRRIATHASRLKLRSERRRGRRGSGGREIFLFWRVLIKYCNSGNSWVLHNKSDYVLKKKKKRKKRRGRVREAKKGKNKRWKELKAWFKTNVITIDDIT